MSPVCLVSSYEEEEMRHGVPQCGDTETQREDDQETEMGVMLPQAKGCSGLPGVGRGQGAFSLEASEGAWPCPHLDFRLQASGTVRK